MIIKAQIRRLITNRSCFWLSGWVSRDPHRSSNPLSRTSCTNNPNTSPVADAWIPCHAVTLLHQQPDAEPASHSNGSPRTWRRVSAWVTLQFSARGTRRDRLVTRRQTRAFRRHTPHPAPIARCQQPRRSAGQSTGSPSVSTLPRSVTTDPLTTASQWWFWLFHYLTS